VGNNSLGINETGSYNVAVGSEALPQNVSSIGTVALGYRAGNRDTNTTNHTGSYNTYLGYMSGLGVPSTTPIYNAIAIGQNSIVSASNTMALGGLGVDEVKVGIGTSTAQYSLVVGGGTNTSSIQVPKGSICVTGSGWCTPGTAGHIAAVAYDSLGADLAENYQVFETGIEVGDIVSVTDLNNSTTTNTTETFGVKKATKNNEVIGIISTAPGVTLGSAGGPNENKLPVALSGRVPVKVNLEGGEIKVGDPITLSSVSGVGMKATSSSQTIGTALTTFDSHSSTNHQGVGKITVFVNLSYTHIDSQISQGQINITSPWTLDEATGQIKLYASLDLSNLDIVNVRSITSASGNWSIDEAGNLVTKSIKTDKLCLGVTCVTEGELQILLNKAQISPILTLPTIDTSPSATTTASTTDPGSGDTNLPDVPAITTPPIVEPVSELSPPPVPPELPAPPEPTPSPEPVAN
ncbi:MAG: hypothetical protein NTV48_03195, partial [Candidatus Vogelbacteria bacterium]|nr:hypothetical protein [Candidatus Vogelbacteria bacterium]